MHETNKEIMKEKVKIILCGGVMPQKQTEGSGAYDLHVPEDTLVMNGRQIIRLGLRIGLPKGYIARVEPRSGYASKGMEGYSASPTSVTRYDCDVLHGIVDSDYTGIIGVIVHNHDLPFHIAKGTRIAQMTLCKVETADFEVVDELEATERGEGGFGHTNYQEQ